jgi:PAS domain S-box-containing protein
MLIFAEFNHYELFNHLRSYPMENIFAVHKQIEQTLRYLAMIAEKANEGIVVLDFDGGIQFVNEAWIEMNGYKTADELIGKQLSLFHTKDQLKTDVTALIEKAKHYGQSEGIIEHVKSDGTVFTSRTRMILVKDDSGKSTGLIIFVTDICQSIKLQEMIAENLKLADAFGQRITRLRKLFGECLEVGQSLEEQAGELQANNEILHKQMTEVERPSQKPELHPKRILHQKTQVKNTNQWLEEAKPKYRQPKESPEHSSEEMAKTKGLKKVLDPKELMEVAKLAMRVSGRS